MPSNESHNAGSSLNYDAAANTVSPPYVDRRTGPQSEVPNERRQFASSHHDLSPDARELALAIDSYKAQNQRRYVTFEEMLMVIHQLGYQKQSDPIKTG